MVPGYNTLVVLAGAALLGAGAGAVGTFLLLRRRVLVTDAIAHAALPGIGLAFLVMVAAGGDGRALPGLLVGAAAIGFLGLMAVEALTRRTRLPEDAAIGAVLSSFFGFGVVLLTVIQSAGVGKPAGLSTLLLGSTAGMLVEEAVAIAIGTLAVVGLLLGMRRPLAMVAFDPVYAETRGISARLYDRALLVLSVGIIVLGLKVAGVVLVVGLTILPPVAARLGASSVAAMLGRAMAIGAVSGAGGAALSASIPNLPTGPVIVLSGFVILIILAVWHRLVAERPA